MSFNFRVIFSGLCAFVPDRPIAPVGPLDEKPTSMRVVMVDARTRTKAVDGGVLEPHFPIAVISTTNLKGRNGILPGTRLEWRLDRKELKFVIQDGTPKGFDLVQGALRGAPAPGSIPDPGALPADTPLAPHDFAWGAHMQEAAPNFARIDPRCFQDAGSMGLVAARVVIDRGELANRAFDPEMTPRYFFDKTLSGGDLAPRPFANTTSLEIKAVSGVQLVARDLDGLQSPEKLTLAGADNEWVEITVSNMDDGRLPERLPDPDLLPTEDADFRWFYSLCANRDQLAGVLNGRLLPVPEPVPGGGPGAVQCMHATFMPSGG